MEQKNWSPWLKDTTKQYINKHFLPIPRKVVASACRSPDGEVMLVGARHFSPTMRAQMKAMGVDKAHDWEQGFIDQWDQFISREEAMDIVLTNDQPLREPVRGDKLYSENLY